MKTEEEIREEINRNQVFIDRGYDNLGDYYKGTADGAISALKWVLEEKEE